MRFCKECDNMLYAKEQVYDQRQNIARLVFECSQCQNLERAKESDQWDNCVYRQDYNQGADAGDSIFKFTVDKDCVKDPTLQRVTGIVCPAIIDGKPCKNDKAVSFTQVTRDRLNLIFVCTECCHYWRKE